MARINTCLECGMNFTKPHNPLRIYQFCSTKCSAVNHKIQTGLFKTGQIPWNKSTQIEFGCLECGEKFIRAGWQIRAGKTKFCSKGCAYKGRVCTMTFQTGHPDLVPKEKRGHTEDTKHKMRITHRENRKIGPEHYNYKGGHRTERKKEMGRYEYKEWRKCVFTRDNYSCQICSKKGVYLEADHIKKWSEFPTLRYDIDNGRTLCVDCHRLTSTWGNKKQKFII